MQPGTKPRKGTFIVELDKDTGEILTIKNRRACVAKPYRLVAPDEREVCGSPGYLELGGLWVCRPHLGAVLQDATAQARDGLEHVVLTDACVFPALTTGRSAPLCGDPVVAMVGGAPACASHHEQALRWHRQLSDREKAAELEASSRIADECERQRELEMRKWDADGSQIIYYLRRADVPHGGLP